MPTYTPDKPFCVLTADASRAALYRYGHEEGTARRTLRKVVELENPSRRIRDSETFSDTRPGLYQAQRGGPRHGLDDRRDHHRREEDRRFAQHILQETERATRDLGSLRLVVAASEKMLGHLREQLPRTARLPDQAEVHELPRDLTLFTAPALHDYLAEADLIPPRERLQ